MTCGKCGEEFTGEQCSCGYVRKAMPAQSPHALRSVVSTKTGIRYYLCTWSSGCLMPVTTMADSADRCLCRWHSQCLNAPDQAANQQAFTSWLTHMQAQYPSRGWWGWEAASLWSVVTGQQTILL